MADKAENGTTAVRRARRAVADPGEGTVTTRRKTGTAAARPAATTRTHAPAAAGAAAVAAPDPGPLDPAQLPVRPGEDHWTAAEVDELRDELTVEAARLREEIDTSEAAISGMMRDSGDGAGDDQVDAGTKNISREHELALANNARDMLAQTERALARLHANAFGLCESCGQAVGKARLQAFPRATLCVQCKAKQERR
ncbi:TraR/DksA family transcriptional regulator [Streptomyces sp. NPDC001380]|uniref:TraR/DksA family transcriptional regulator n=1 Tax=Streptomyces sp. NPDC001380 TaxID=3364566 RepID=UPI0036C056FE